MDTHSEVLSDVIELRAQLRSLGGAHRDLLRLNPWRPLLDIAVDWVAIFASVAAVFWIGGWLAPLAVVIIANRQRALGNILHDAGHRNLLRSRRVNDAVARALVAPLLFASLAAYRTSHFRHHLDLGGAGKDPDLLPVPRQLPAHWARSVVAQAFVWRIWLASVAGHLASPDVPLVDKLGIAAWWVAAIGILSTVFGSSFAWMFAGLWLLSRATTFHLITVFREMCDHYGLQPGGIFSYTRDMTCHGLWRWLLHPRNNGYHLTHHLLPAVPYYRLPEAQRLFLQMPAYQRKGQVCDGYFSGAKPVVCWWQRGAQP